MSSEAATGKATFNSGDVVTLVSGGPRMTVDFQLTPHTGTGKYRCCWISEKGTLYTGEFYAATLRHCDPAMKPNVALESLMAELSQYREENAKLHNDIKTQTDNATQALRTLGAIQEVVDAHEKADDRRSVESQGFPDLPGRIASHLESLRNTLQINLNQAETIRALKQQVTEAGYKPEPQPEGENAEPEPMAEAVERRPLEGKYYVWYVPRKAFRDEKCRDKVVAMANAFSEYSGGCVTIFPTDKDWHIVEVGIPAAEQPAELHGFHFETPSLEKYLAISGADPKLAALVNSVWFCPYLHAGVKNGTLNLAHAYITQPKPNPDANLKAEVEAWKTDAHRKEKRIKELEEILAGLPMAEAAHDGGEGPKVLPDADVAVLNAIERMTSVEWDSPELGPKKCVFSFRNKEDAHNLWLALRGLLNGDS